ncbi:hypothetical protein ATCC90586_000111 [Pythium insidiosum]|nr:hypothetical protein ATCC90586_000111 [Pythium insidiosum]
MVCAGAAPSVVLGADTAACQDLIDVFKSDDYKQCVNELKGKWQTPLTFLGGNANPNKDVPETMCKYDACKKYISKVKSINADNCPFSHRGIDMIVKKVDFEIDRIDKACKNDTPITQAPSPTGACQDLTDVFKSDDYKQCVNELKGTWQTPLTFLGATQNPNKDVPETMCKYDACKKYISKVKSINADNCPFSHRGIDMVVKKSDFELERIDKACGKQETPDIPTGACHELTDVFKTDEYKQCVNELKGKWQTPLTFLGGNANPNKDVPETMCKNDACKKYIGMVRSINADNCPFSHRGIDMIVKKADFELERIDKACNVGSGSNSNSSKNNATTNPSTTQPQTQPSTPSSTRTSSRADSSSRGADGVATADTDDTIATPAPSSKPALRDGSTPVPTKQSAAATSVHVVSSVLALSTRTSAAPTALHAVAATALAVVASAAIGL